MATNKAYDGQDVKHLNNRDAVRAKPSMYLGEPGEACAWTVTREVTDNVVDEALNGHASLCEIVFDEDGSYWVYDDGRGMPVGTMTVKDSVSEKAHKVPALQAITGLLHAGAKLEQGGTAYAISRGCFHADTKIRLLDNRVLTIEQIYEEWTRNEKLIPILSYNVKKQRLEPSTISFAQIAKHTKSLVEVTYDNGHSAKVTPDHPFFVWRGGSIKKVVAERLQKGDSLISSYYGQDRDGYPTVTENGGSRRLHQLVAQYALNRGAPVVEPMQVHHHNRIRTDARPSNLEITSAADHQREHVPDRADFARGKILETQQELRAQNSEQFSLQNIDEGHKRAAQQTKAIRVAIRAIALHGRLTARSYDAVRKGTEASYAKAVSWFTTEASFHDAVAEGKSRAEQRVGYSYKAEDLLAGRAAPVRTPAEQSLLGSVAAQLANFKRRLLAFENPRLVTPSMWNSSGKGAWKRGDGPYARLCALTSLKALKEHVLDGDELRIYVDLSPEAVTRRRINAELRIATQQQVVTVVTRATAVLKRLAAKSRALTRANYEKARGLSSPTTDIAFAFIAAHLGITEEVLDQDTLDDFVSVWNHTVRSVRPLKFKNAIPVYDITVDKNHTFFIEAGPGTRTSIKNRGTVIEHAHSSVLVSNSHGIGMKGTNFTGKFFEVWTKPKEGWHYIGYKDGKLTTPMEKCKAPEHPASNKPITKGTLVHFKPDPKIIGADKFSLTYLVEWASVAAYFTPNFTVSATLANGKTRTWNYPEGPSQYVVDQVAKLKVEHVQGKTFTLVNSLVSCVAAFTTHGACELAGFTNGLRNPSRGNHFDAFFAALTAAIEPYRKRAHKFSPSDLREGVIGLVNVNLSAPKFGGQTKDRLVDERAGAPLKAMLLEALVEFFKKNKSTADWLCERAQAMSELKAKFTAGKKVVNALKSARRGGLPAKAQTSPHCKPEDRELFIVEGDSAAGSCRSARDNRYQEALPIKGKIMNAWKAKDLDSVLLSEEVLNILTMVGFDPSVPDPLSKLRVGKIILLSDPDPDGPLHPDTLIPVYWEGQWQTVRIQELAMYPWTDRIFKVVARTMEGRYKLTLCDGVRAYALRAGESETQVTWSNGTKVVCTTNHRWPSTRSEAVGASRRTVNYLGEKPGEGEMQFLRADSLKCGDTIWSVEDQFASAGFDTPHPQRVLAPNYQPTHDRVAVAKVKTYSKAEARTFYCLSIPEHHNFMLANGVFSGNCHINDLELGLLWKVLPGVFARGMVYVAEAPEFYAKVGKNAYAFDDSARALRSRLDEMGAAKSTEIHHVKGYGELDAPLLRTMAFDPATRKLSRITVSDTASGVHFSKLMADDPETRRALMGI